MSDADHTPMLTTPALFKTICENEGYPLIDFEHYRLRILNASRAEGKVLMPYKWRARIATWLENDKLKNKLILVAVPGQTTSTPAPPSLKDKLKKQRQPVL